MTTGLVKRPDSKVLAISTAAANLDSPLGRMRARALAQPTAKRTGAVVEATGDLHWLEWSLADARTSTTWPRSSLKATATVRW